jgi:hypothetical protein
MDERGQRAQYEAQEGWTYELRVKPPTPRWVLEEKMTKGHAPSKPNELVMVGLQLEDGPRCERKVKRSLGEHGLKVLPWDLFDWPPGPLYVHIVSSRGETEFAFRIEPQWTYILRAQPLKMIRKEREPDRAREEAVQSRPKSKEPTRVKGQLTLGLGAKRHITGWCGTKTLELTVGDTIMQGDLIDRIADKLGEPRGSYAMEIKDRGGSLRNEYQVVEGWSYIIYRMSPPGTQQATDLSLRHRGNEVRPLLNRSSASAWHEEELSRRDEIRRNETVALNCTMDSERRQVVEVREDIAAEALTKCIMEKYGMTGWGYLTVCWGGKPGSFSISELAEYRVSARMTPTHCAKGFREGRGAVRFTAFERREEEERGERAEARTAAPGMSRTSRMTVGSSPRLG